MHCCCCCAATIAVAAETVDTIGGWKVEATEFGSFRGLKLLSLSWLDRNVGFRPFVSLISVEDSMRFFEIQREFASL